VISFLAGLCTGLAMALAAFVLWSTLVVGKWADEGGFVNLVADGDKAPVTESEELTRLRHQLATCQDAARQQRERADHYYDLFCVGAKANADLRRKL